MGCKEIRGSPRVYILLTVYMLRLCAWILVLLRDTNCSGSLLTPRYSLIGGMCHSAGCTRALPCQLWTSFVVLQ